MLSNCSCIEIVDNEYRIITSEVKAHNIKEAYALRGFYQDGKYYEEKLPQTELPVCGDFCVGRGKPKRRAYAIYVALPHAIVLPTQK